MSAIIQAVKKNLDITQNKPFLKFRSTKLFRKTIILGEILQVRVLTRKNSRLELNISRTPIHTLLTRLTKEHETSLRLASSAKEFRLKTRMKFTKLKITRHIGNN